MNRCEKHGCCYDVRQMEHGKTMYVCPECEKERLDRFIEMFGFTDDRPVIPFCGGKQKTSTEPAGQR